MKFSVIIPVYNVHAYLQRCVESVQQQTYKALEIILVDDGSTDGSGLLCDELVMQDSRIQVIHKANGGLSDARNAGLHAATGDYVLFLDSDDVWLLAEGLERINEALEKNPTDLLLFKRVNLYPVKSDTLSVADCRRSREYDYEKQFISTHSVEEVFTNLVRTQRFCMSACFQAIRRMFLTDNNIYFPLGMLSEDLDWSLHLWQHVHTLQALNIDMYGYWHRKGSISTTYSIRNLRCYDVMFTTWSQRLPQLNHCYAQTVAAYLASMYVSCLYQYGQIAAVNKKEARTIFKRHRTLLRYSLDKKARRAYVVHKFCGFYGMLWLFAGYGCLKRYMARNRRKLVKTTTHNRKV